MTLTILCVTEFNDYALPFLNRMELLAEELHADFIEYDGGRAFAIEEILDNAIAECPDGYILRLDDDEYPTPEMVAWLHNHSYEEADHWAFPRLNLWGDEWH